MRRRVQLLSLCSLMMLLVALCLVWLMGTAQGAWLVLDSLARAAGARLSVQKVTGSLAGDLRLEGASLKLSDMEMHVGALHLVWRPIYLIARTVAVKELSLHQTVIRGGRTETDLTWPKVPAWLAWMKGWIGRFHVSGLTYHSADDEPVRIESLESSLIWYDGKLAMDKTHAKLGSGRVEGSLSIGLVRPALTAALTFFSIEPAGEHIQFSLNAQLGAARMPKQVSGSMTLVATRGSAPQLRAAGGVSLTKTAIILDAVHVSEQDRKGSIRVDGDIDLSAPDVMFNLRTTAQALELTREFRGRALLSGTLDLRGTIHAYAGRFNMRSVGDSWRTAQVSGTFEGNDRAVGVKLGEGAMLGGSILGSVQATFEDTFAVRGSLQARNLNLGHALPAVSGVVNVNVEGSLSVADERIRASGSAVLLDSELHGHPLSGRIEATFDRDRLAIPNLELRSRELNLTARGVLQERVAYNLYVGDVAGLLPEATGRISATGWLRWLDDNISGRVSGTGDNISIRGVSARAMSLVLEAEHGLRGPVHGKLTLRNLHYDSVVLDSVSAELKGSARAHAVTFNARWAHGSTMAALRGAYDQSVWQATIECLDGRDAVGPWSLRESSTILLSAKRIAIRPLALLGREGERLDLSADLALTPRVTGHVTLGWQSINLRRLAALFPGSLIAGSSTGALKAEWSETDGLRLAGAAQLAGSLSHDKISLSLKQASANVSWDRQGLLASLECALAEGGLVRGRIASSEVAGASLPEQARLHMVWKGIDLGLLRAWLPDGVKVAGQISGMVSGNTLPGLQLDVQGETSVTGGGITWSAPDGLVTAAVERATVHWTWVRDILAGNLALRLSHYGDVKASFRVPLLSRIPPDVERDTPLYLAATGDVEAHGLLTALFPGLVQEGTGRLTFEVGSNGTWRKPAFRGHISLSRAGAYLPPAGIHLKDVEARAELEENGIRLTSFSVRSGPGTITGTGRVSMEGWRVTRFEAALQGERFQTVYLPELDILTNPELRLQGTMTSISVRGTIHVPELRLRLPDTQGVVRASPDVKLVNGPAEVPATLKQPPGPALDVEVRITLGDRVRVLAMGIDAQLGGGLLVTARNLDDVTAFGEIRVTKGQYSAAGIRLDITRGRVIFSGEPLEKSTLDVTAVRKIPLVRPTKRTLDDEVRVGVNVGGTVSSPVIKLYSEPAMPDSEILSYLIFGRPLVAGAESAAILGQLGGSLLAAGPSSGVLEALKSGVGIDTIDIEPGATDITRSLVTVGKYLTPDLYLSLGHSLFTGENLVKARYKLSKRWEVESASSATAVGADIFFRIEFR